MEKLRQHYRKVEKQDIPASQMAFENSGSSGESGLAALRAQLLKREEELRRKEQEDTERSRAEQLRKNDNAVMDSGVLRAAASMARFPCLATGEMTCYLLLHNRNGEYTLWGNELEKYRTRIFESVDLMRGPDRSEIGQRPPLQRVCSSATFEQLLTQVCQTWPHSRTRQPKTWLESFCLRRPPASHAITSGKEGGFYAGTSATDADAGHEFCRPGNPPAFAGHGRG
ncbi:hypothetical protein [Escherichia coli]